MEKELKSNDYRNAFQKTFLNKCSKCKKYTSSTNMLVKINNKWFCTECLIYNKDLFKKLKKNGYIYKILKNFIHFKLDD